MLSPYSLPAKAVVRLLLAAAIAMATLPAQLPPDPAALSGYTPLTSEERWHRYWQESFSSPGLYFASLGSAIEGQLANDPPEWRQGVGGFSLRSASLFGMFTIQTTIYEAGTAAMGLEPRYQRCDCKGFPRRIGHALKWSVVTLNNAGKVRPNLPALAGGYGSGMLAMSWYPDRYHSLSDGVRLGNQQAGFMAGINLIREFGPELKRLLRFVH